MNLTEIFILILLISASILCIALIYFLSKIVKSVQSISLNLQRSLLKVNPLIESTLELSKKVTHITDEIKSQLEIVRSMIRDVRERFDKILVTEARIRSGIENTVMPAIKNISAVGTGIEMFWKSYKQK